MDGVLADVQHFYWTSDHVGYACVCVCVWIRGVCKLLTVHFWRCCCRWNLPAHLASSFPSFSLFHSINCILLYLFIDFMTTIFTWKRQAEYNAPFLWWLFLYFDSHSWRSVESWITDVTRNVQNANFPKCTFHWHLNSVFFLSLTLPSLISLPFTGCGVSYWHEAWIWREAWQLNRGLHITI